MEKGQSLQKMVLGKQEGCMQENGTRPLTDSRINSKVVKDVILSHDTMNVLVENTGSKISDIPRRMTYLLVQGRQRKK